MLARHVEFWVGGARKVGLTPRVLSGAPTQLSFSTHFLHSHDVFNRKGSTTLRLQAMKITQLSRIFTTQKFLYIQEISTPVSRV